MKKNSFVLSIMLMALVCVFAFSIESSRSEREPGARLPSGDQAGEMLTAPKGEVLVTNRLDIDFSKRIVTFIEIGADRCIPCRAMQPIMKDIAARFPEDVQVVFYDVWKDPEPGRHYRIQLIPTQVFIGKDGNEFHRHVGLYDKAKIIKLLTEKGVKK